MKTDYMFDQNLSCQTFYFGGLINANQNLESPLQAYHSLLTHALNSFTNLDALWLRCFWVLQYLRVTRNKSNVN